MAEKRPDSSPDFNALSQRSGKPVPGFLPTPFRTSLKFVPGPAAPELDDLFADGAGLIYDQTVTSYLQAFTSPRHPMKAVLRDLSHVWNRHGFLPIDDLTIRLLERTHPDLPAAASSVLYKQIQSRYRDPEPLTGYDRKQHAPLTIGLGHLYGVLTDRPAALVMVDDSNLGGLMEHLDKLMAARDGRPPGETAEGSESYRMADRILTVMAGVTRSAIEDGIRDSRRMASLAAYRTGGDEKSFLITGMEQADVQHLVSQRATPAVEDLMARLGLQGHEHVKDRDDRLRAGTGTALSVMMLDRQTRPGADRIAAEEALSGIKLDVGVDRRGRLSRDFFNGLGSRMPPTDLPLRLREEGVIDYAEPLGTRDLYNLFQLEEANRRVREAAGKRDRFNQLAEESGTQHDRQAQRLDRVRASTNPVTGETEWHDDRRITPYNMEPEQAANILAAMEKVLKRPEYARFLEPQPAPPQAPRGSDRPNLLFATPIELETLRFDYNITRTGTVLTPPQQQLCHNLLGSFSPVDPATGTLMKDVMPELFGRFARDTDHLRELVRNDPTLIRTNPDSLQSFAVAASLQNLAGVNKLLSSENANIVLRHFSEEVVQGSFAACGISSSHIESGHEGGGHLMTLVRPVVSSGARRRCVDEKLIGKVEATMAKRMRAWRREKVADFLERHGGSVPADLDRNLSFGDIKDPKRSQRGIRLTTASMALATSDESGRILTGGKLRTRLAEIRDAKIDQERSGERASRKLPASTGPV